MSRVLDFGDAGHRRTELDLPWYVNGTLEPEACVRIERHLAACDRCRRDEHELRRFQHRYAAVVEQEEAAADFAPLRRRIEVERASARPAEKQGADTAWLRWAMAAQVFALALLTVWVLRGDLRAGSYRTLGADPAPRADATAGTHRALLVFEPSLPQARMLQLLRANGARIVGGPNAAGAYLVSLTSGNPALALRNLRAAPGVSLAESVDPEPER